MLDELKRMALITSGLAELTKARAEHVVKDLVAQGDVRRDQASALVRELVKKSAENRREIARFVRDEVRSQIENLGLATKKEVERLERKVARLEARSAEEKSSKPAAGKKSSEKKPPAKKPTPRRTTAGGKSVTSDPDARGENRQGD